MPRAMSDSEKKIKARMIRQGHWKEFIEIKNRLMAAEMNMADAWVEAAKQFPERATASAATAAVSNQSGGLRRLAKKVDTSRAAGVRSIAEWVFENAFSDAADIDVDSVPSRGAVGLLEWVQKGAANYSQFIATIWSKLLPTKGQLDAEARFADDGRVQLAMLDEFEASWTSTFDVSLGDE